MTPYYSSEVENIVNQASENNKPLPVHTNANKLFRTKLWSSYLDVYVLTYVHKPHAAVKCIVGYLAAPGQNSCLIYA